MVIFTEYAMEWKKNEEFEKLKKFSIVKARVLMCVRAHMHLYV